MVLINTLRLPDPSDRQLVLIHPVSLTPRTSSYFQQSENFMSAGHLGKARLYSDMHTASRCSTGASNRHFMAPCVPMGSVMRPRRPRLVYTSTGLNGT